MACTPMIDSFQAVKADLEVSEKYIQLMQDTLGDDSLYIRSKDTLLRTFKDLQITEKEKAELVLSYVTQFSISLSSAAMQTSLSWAKEERDGTYSLAKVKADTEVSLANFEKTKSEICQVEKQTALTCAQTTAASATSIRENGTVTAYEADGCLVKTLGTNGLKYEQTKQVQGATYQIQADAFRKSGVVQIGIGTDSVVKGLSGDANGYTHQQEINAERLRIAYEDSKLNHAANASASMIASMLTAEIAPAEADVDRWREAIDGLLLKHSTTNQT